MTNGNSSGGTAVALVNSSDPGIKHSLRSASKTAATTTEHHLQDVALVHEEDKLIDEDLTSVEDNHEVTSETSVERTMMAVAMVNSVVHSSAETVTNAEPGQGLKSNGPSSSNKRGRKADDSLDASSTRGQRRRTTGAQIKDSTSPALLPSSAKIRTRAPSASAPPGPETKSHSHGTRQASKNPKLRSPKKSAIPTPTISSVPNPLAQIATPITKPGAQVPTATPASGPPEVAVPCPLSTEEPEGVVKSDAMLSAPDSIDKRKVTISEPSSGQRFRGLSIDIDLNLDFGDDESANGGAGSDGPLVGGRDRAFSFECFAFGINADEPLPPLEQSSSLHVQTLPEMGISSGSRPRGDSIIFDPSSFQDGGIHEQSALERARARASSIEAPLSKPKGRHLGEPKSSTTSVARPPAPVPSCSSTHAPVPTVTPSTATNMTVMPGNPVSASTLSLELVNKDGRIGIYLPEDRRARIARFHAKRAKRIWRKRIKYDCRKKLADSRPRIKGRFVKRSDMDD